MSDERYRERQQRLKDKVDARVAAAQDERGIVMVFTGNGKGKTTAAFGTATRAVGHGKKVGVIQDRDSDPAACLAVWEHARRMLADDQLDLVLLDELTYMVAYDYLPLESVLSALRERPAHQSVIITGRGCHRDIIELADTVSELRPVKHAFDAGIKAQMGIDY